MTKFYAYWLLVDRFTLPIPKPVVIPKGCQYYCPQKKRWLKERADSHWWQYLIRRWPVKQGQGTRSRREYAKHLERNKGL